MDRNGRMLTCQQAISNGIGDEVAGRIVGEGADCCCLKDRSRNDGGIVVLLRVKIQVTLK